jgi:flagellin
MSLTAQRNLGKSQSALSTSIQRLSSGLRINSAKDDAAGLAISNRFTSQIQGMSQAARNANDGISLAQTAEGALQQTTNNLHRMRQLAVQSANKTNAESDRKSIDAEFQQLLAENNRIATTTSFNGLNVLNGSLGDSAFQVGANVSETISVDLTSSMENKSIGALAKGEVKLTNVPVAEPSGTSTPKPGTDVVYTDGALLIDGKKIPVPTKDLTGIAIDSEVHSVNSAIQLAATINSQSATTGITAKAKPATITFDSTSAVFDSAGTAQLTLTINGKMILRQNKSSGATAPVDSKGLVAAINAKSDETGVTASVVGTSGMILTVFDGRNIVIEEVGVESTDSGYFSAVTSTTVTKGFYRAPL